jgi:hypothetical protein
MTNAISTTVSWADLTAAYDTELDDLRDAYNELCTQAESEYGEGWQSHPATDETLQVYQQQAQQYDEAAKSIQKRQHLLKQLKAEYGDGNFELKMLTGKETMQVETELRVLAQQEDVSIDVIQVRRNALTVDAATVDAPEGIPRDDDGSPVPSECPNALTLALWEQVESLNNAGETGFTAEGFGDSTRLSTADTSATPTASAASSTPSAPDDEN